jgi:hypothetical protein
MLAKNNNRLIQNCHHVFHPTNFVTNSAERLQNPDDDLIPQPNKAIAILWIEEWKNEDAKH